MVMSEMVQMIPCSNQRGETNRECILDIRF